MADMFRLNNTQENNLLFSVHQVAEKKTLSVIWAYEGRIHQDVTWPEPLIFAMPAYLCGIIHDDRGIS
jgi:hypothetical protein